MTLSLTNYEGIFPVLTAESLPEAAAQSAINTRLRRGALALLTTPSASTPMSRMHDASYDLIEGITGDDQDPIEAPIAAPTVNSDRVKMCNIGTATGGTGSTWLSIRIMHWYSFMNASGNIEYGEFYKNLNYPTDTDFSDAGEYLEWGAEDVRYHPTGISIHATYPSMSGSRTHTGETTLYGPLFSIELADDSPNFDDGGPDGASNWPEHPHYANDPWPKCRIPLFFKGRHYGVFAVEQIRAPDWREVIPAATTFNFSQLAGTVDIFINLNYTEPRQRYYRFVQTKVIDYDTSFREGPPSEVSDLILVQPGERIQVDLLGYTASGQDGTRLYRGGESGDDFRLVDEWDTTKWLRGDPISGTSPSAWKDSLLGDTDISLPPYGELPSGITFKGSLVHSAGFGAAIKEGGNDLDELWFTNVERLNVWPAEWAHSWFKEDLVALALIGATILVFTNKNASSPVTGKVWAFHGSHPSSMTAHLLSDNTPLLLDSNDKAKSLVRWNERIYWVTWDGLAATNGHQIEIVTRAQFDRLAWKSFPVTIDPPEYEAVAGDEAIWLGGAGVSGHQLLLELDQSQIRISEWIGTIASADGAITISGTQLWKSKKIVHDAPTVYRWARFTGTAGSFKLTVIRDGSTVINAQAVSIVAGSTLFDMATLSAAAIIDPGTNWEFQISELTGTIVLEKADFYDRQTRQIEYVSSEAGSRGEISPWQRTRYELKSPAKFAGYMVTLVGGMTTATPAITIRFFANGSLTALFTATVTSGLYQRISDTTLISSYEYDFILASGAGANQYVDQATIAMRIIQPAPQDGPVELRDVPCWRGNMVKFEDGGAFACLSLEADAYTSANNKVVLYKDHLTTPVDAGGVKFSEFLQNSIPGVYLLPRSSYAAQGGTWEIDVEQTSADRTRVHSLRAWPRRKVEIGRDMLHIIAGDDEVQKWIWAEFDPECKIEITSIRVITSSSVSFSLYADGATSTTPQTIPNSEEVRLTNPVICSHFGFNFGETTDTYKNRLVKELYIFFHVVEDAGEIAQTSQYPIKKLGHAWRFKGKTELAAVQVAIRAYSGDPLVRFRIDGTLDANTITPTGREAKLLPREWESSVRSMTQVEADVETTAELEQLIVLPRKRVDAGPIIQYTGNDPLRQPWISIRHQFATSEKPVTGMVIADTDVYDDPLKLFVYKNGAVADITGGTGITVSNSAEFWLPNSEEFESLDFNFANLDGRVRQPWIFSEKAEMLQGGGDGPGSGGGFILRPAGERRSWRRVLLHFKETGTFNVLRVAADDYSDLRVRLFDPDDMPSTSADGENKALVNITVENDNEIAFTPPTPRRAYILDVDDGSGGGYTGTIHEMHLIAKVEREFNGRFLQLKYEQDPWSWLNLEVFSNRLVMIRNARILSSVFPVTLNMKCNGESLRSLEVQDSDALHLPRTSLARRWSFSLDSEERKLIHALELGSSMDALRGGK